MKTILLTGDSRGVGEIIANTLLNNGEYKLIGISRKTTNNVERLMKQHKDCYIHINYDLTNVEGIKDLYLQHIKPLGPIHGYINNAAIAYDDIITNLMFEPLKEMYEVNVFSPMLITKYILRDMLLHKTKGSIIHLSSISVHTGYKGLAMYASTKGALEAFSKNTAREWGRMGIRSNIVCPGFMATDMSSSLSSEQQNKIFNRNSMGKPINIESVASTIEFLLSEKSNSITGQVVHTDNGTI
jgi:3-oxoacyl-[acyl-carrier protein] reductase